MSDDVVGDVRRIIELGLERYRQGELSEAVLEWEEALRLDATNEEAQRLIAYVRDLQSTRRTTPAIAVVAASLEEDWPDKERTQPEMEHETIERVLRAETEAAAAAEAADDAADARGDDGFRRRNTIQSPISELLAPLTSPGWNAGSPTREAGAPAAPLFEDDTRKLGSDQHKTPAGRVPEFSGARSDDPAKEHRVRASELVDRCRAERHNNQPAAAARAAEDALRESEAAPFPGIAEVIEPARPFLEQVFEAHVGPAQGVPAVALTPEKMAKQAFDHRAGFLLSRIDGVLNIEQLLEISGMSRFDTLRILSTLLRAKAIRLLSAGGRRAPR